MSAATAAATAVTAVTAVTAATAAVGPGDPRFNKGPPSGIPAGGTR